MSKEKTLNEGIASPKANTDAWDKLKEVVRYGIELTFPKRVSHWQKELDNFLSACGMPLLEQGHPVRKAVTMLVPGHESVANVIRLANAFFSPPRGSTPLKSLEKESASIREESDRIRHTDPDWVLFSGLSRSPDSILSPDEIDLIRRSSSQVDE